MRMARTAWLAVAKPGSNFDAAAADREIRLTSGAAANALAAAFTNDLRFMPAPSFDLSPTVRAQPRKSTSFRIREF